MNRNPARTVLIAAAASLALAGAAAGNDYPSGDPSSGDDLSYGYLRTVEGPARLVQAASGAAVEAEANYPVLAGDRLTTGDGGRIEASLPDFNVVRLGGAGALTLARLALSADSSDDHTVLQLDQGEIQLLVKDLLPVAERPRVDTANVTVYLQGSGVYSISTDGYGWTEVVVRRGFAELATARGSSVVRTGERAWIDGARQPLIGIDRAAGYSELELWGAELDDELDADLAAWRDTAPAAYDEPLVEDHLTYAAAPLARHGSWVEVDAGWAWRPHVAAGWRPYTAGWWADSPSGLVWVSHEPWGWMTYHYGSWVPSPAYGWVWRPGPRFAPAWVYWHWGPTWVAWVPVGYYTGYYGHYRPYGHAFRFGVYGWAGGSWSAYADWSFCDRRWLRRRDLRHHARTGHHWARDTRSPGPGRGLLTTDSRPETLRRAVPRTAESTRPGRDLPDVTAFVARERQLPREVTDRMFTTRRAVARGRDDGWEAPAVALGAAGSRRGTARGVDRVIERGADRGADRSAERGADRGADRGTDAARGPAVVERVPRATWRGPTGRVQPGTRSDEAPGERRAVPARPADSSPRFTPPRAPRQEQPTERVDGPRAPVRRALPAPRERYTPPPPRYTPPSDRYAAPPSRSPSSRPLSPRATSPRSPSPRAAAPRYPAPRYPGVGERAAPSPRYAPPRDAPAPPATSRPPVVRRVLESIRAQQRAGRSTPRALPPSGARPQSAAPGGSARRAPGPPRPSARPAPPPSNRPSARAPQRSGNQRPSARPAPRSNRSSDGARRSGGRQRAQRRPPDG